MSDAPPRRAAAALIGLDPAALAASPHALQSPDAVWQEKNCYVDLWIGLLHALGLEPHALWPFALEGDFLGDQWTFSKPPPEDLRALYGIELFEMTVWRPLAEHALEHLAAGRPLAVEVDAWWLPDVAATDYRRQHTKTTIVMAALDLDARTLTYFHNAGCFTLHGEDLDGVLGPTDRADALPLYAELLRLEGLVRRDPADLRALARERLRAALARVDARPAGSPVARFAARVAEELPRLRAAGLDTYHAWAFVTVRQLGAAAELAARGLAWQAEGAADDEVAAMRAAQARLDAVATGAKALILKLARAVGTTKDVDAATLLAPIEAAWDAAFEALAALR